jgi:hypothetical protein
MENENHMFHVGMSFFGIADPKKEGEKGRKEK